MINYPPLEDTETILSGLKGFQRQTAKYVFDMLYGQDGNARRFLIADEVGLGKTLVAAGVIAQAIDYLQSLNTPRIDIVYVCSNQAIARQNVARISDRLPISSNPLPERITLLPHRLDSLDQPVNLIALTPGTSFNSASAEGVVEERVILYRLLSGAWGDLGDNSRLVFKGDLSSVARFKEHEFSYRCRKIDEKIIERFNEAVGGPDSELHREFIAVRDHLAMGLNNGSRRQRQRLVGTFRRHLAHACLDALEPHLIILDEFQRFRELLDPCTLSGELAHHLIQGQGMHSAVPTLLLSATPYKMLTLSHESDEDHYRDFLQTVRFLAGDEGIVKSLEELLREFRLQIPLAASRDDIGADARTRLSEIRTKIQSELGRLMCRTERRGRVGGGDPMLQISYMSADLDVGDVESYLAAREIANLVRAPNVIEYWKSAPYLLSFMDQYRLSDRVSAASEAEPNGAVAKLIQKSARIQLRRTTIEQRRSIPGGNGRMRGLLLDLTRNRLNRLLWLPPSLPTHTLGSDFERARTASKRLVFSSWAMVPRAVAVLGSYDVERRYVRGRPRDGRYEARLLPVRGDAYSLFALMCPSRTLADAGDALRYAERSPGRLLSAIENTLRPRNRAGKPCSGR